MKCVRARTIFVPDSIESSTLDASGWAGHKFGLSILATGLYANAYSRLVCERDGETSDWLDAPEATYDETAD